MQKAQRADHVIVVLHRLTRAHDDDGIDARALLPQVIRHANHLRGDLPHGQITRQTVQRRRAECTAHAAARLRRDTDTVAVGMAHEHRLRRLPIGKRIEQLDRRAVCRRQARTDLRPLNGKALRQLRAQHLRQIVHDIKRDRAALIHPADDLIGAEAGNPLGAKGIGKLCLRPSKNIHRRLIRAIKKPSGPPVSGMICTMRSAVFCSGKNAPVSSRTKSSCPRRNASTTAAFSLRSIVQVL